MCIRHGCLPRLRKRRNQWNRLGYEFRPEIYGSDGYKVIWKILGVVFVEESFLRNDDVGDERSREIFPSAYSLSFLKTNFYHSYLPSNCIFCSFFFFSSFHLFSSRIQLFYSIFDFFLRQECNEHACNSKNIK